MVSGELEQHPVYQLARQVLENGLTVAAALDQVAALAPEELRDAEALQALIACAYAWRHQDLSQARTLAKLVCRAADRNGDVELRGNCYSTLGFLHWKLDQMDQALACYATALSHLGSVPESPASFQAVARVCLDMAQIDQHRGELAQAQEKFAAVRVLARRTEFFKLECDAHNGLGSVHLAQGHADAALEAYQAALRISQRSADKLGERDAWGSLGRVQRFLGRRQDAVDAHRKAVALSREIPGPALLGHQLGMLGSALVETGRLDEAEGHLLEALEIARQLGDRSSEQLRLGSLGNLYQARAGRAAASAPLDGLLETALQYVQAALDIARERDDRRGMANYLLNLGHLYARQRRFDEARDCYEQALPLALELDALDIQWRIHYAWGDLLAAQNQDRAAWERYAAAVKTVEQQRDMLHVPSRTAFWQERAALYKQTALCCWRLGELWPALAYTERAKTRYLIDLLAERGSLDGADGSPADLPDVPATTPTQEFIAGTLAALPAFTAVVIFNVTPTGTLVFIVVNDVPDKTASSAAGWKRSPTGRIRARLVRDFTRNDLQDLLVQTDDAGRLTGGYLKNYYDKRQQWRTSDLDAVLARVYGALLADVHQELRALSIERVVFMPNLGLSLIPLHACYRDGESGRDYLLDHYDISYAPSFGLLRHATERAADEQRGGRSLFAVADPERNLKWAGVEVARIAEFFPQHRILGGGAEDRATLQAVSEEMPGHAYVHFACHGLFDPGDPLRSRLALTPDSDPLTLKTILLGETSEPQPGSISRVGPFAWPRARLAVMSACETGLVDPSDRADESFGLAAGLLLGGVPAVIGTLWAVDDRSTALLMQRFYLYLVRGDPCRPDEGPLSIASALRRAQSWLRDEATSPQGSEFQAGAQSEGDLPVGAAGTDHAPEGQAHRHQQRVLGNHGVHALSPEGSQQTAQACRFASPYYWAAFTVTGAEPRASGLDDER